MAENVLARVAITGGTGSFGQVFTRYCLDQGAERVAIVSRDEYKQAVMAEEFQAHADRLRFFLGDVRDQQRLEQTFTGCETVVHAAALKRVQESVYSPSELIKTNILGTMNVINAATAVGVSRVLLISSDKAVEATNLYGKTKACAEDYAVQANSYTFPRGSRISVVRYGNVLNSRGSVLGIWARQVVESEKLTMTEPSMTRFLISLRQAALFVHGALWDMQGGEIFIPSLQSCTIEALADLLYPGYPRTTTGRRPGGEKLHEVLLSQEEMLRVFWARSGPEPGFAVHPSFRSWTEQLYNRPVAIIRSAGYSSETEQMGSAALCQYLKEEGYL
jgi:UDP-N-acetylglucosamine 4,6-dehydratase/5-epimerase